MRFTANGRKLLYVTYWGEGHGVLSPANIRDTWERILEWLDRNLASENEKPPS